MKARVLFGVFGFAFVLLALYVLGYFFLYRKGKLEGETSEVIYKFLPKEKKKE